MNLVFKTILENLNTAACFVFPSETAAFLWARKICLHGELRSLSSERFLAWDRFKEDTIRSKDRKNKPVSAFVRRLFALSLAQKNAASPFLQAIIPVQYAENSTVFADSIAALLSSLKRWEELQEEKGIRDDEEDRDLRVIKTSYAAFMQENGLFEPSWEKIHFQKSENHYIIFFPEAIEDFREYKDFLKDAGVSFFSLQEHSCNNLACRIAEKPILNFFSSARLEIRSAVLELRRLCDTGMPYEDVAITLCGYKNIAPYVERELALHDIPFIRRAGKNLGEYPIGALFSLINECAASLFSFDAVKRLLLNNCIPWKDCEKNRALIEYGIINHCAAPFRDRSRTADAWEEGFKQNPSVDLAVYYGELKKAVKALSGAVSFRKILEQYHVFRSFLAMEKCSAESNAVLARCIEELSVLIEAEESLKGLDIVVPFNFYISHLKNKSYVYAGSEGGVNLYDYPVAAGAPFGCHMLLNVSQSAAVFQYRPLPFLRPDKRVRLGITDTDASAAMLSLYVLDPYKDYHCHTCISASEKTFTGWAIPHSAFAQNQIKTGSCAGNAGEIFIEDLFGEEQQWRRNLTALNCVELAAPAHIHPISLTPGDLASLNRINKPAQLYSVQKESFKRWAANLLNAKPDAAGFIYTGDAAKQLRKKIRSKNAGKAEGSTAELSVSASDLNDFFNCPVMWLYSRILRLEKFQLDASLLDAESLGLVYHRILERLFERIKNTDTCFAKENLGIYFNWLEEITVSVLRSNDTLRGPLVYPLLSPLASAINRRLRTLLKSEARYFNGFMVRELEQGYNVCKGKLLLNGFLDRVSEGPDGPMIVDYKTGKPPLQSHCRLDEVNGLLDFQIPMYIKLYEEVSGNKVNSALFAGINNHEFVSVVGAFKKKDFSREEYQDTLDALDRAIEVFVEAVARLDFTREKTHPKACIKCIYRTICRSQYYLNPKAGCRKAEFFIEEDEYDY